MLPKTGHTVRDVQSAHDGGGGGGGFEIPGHHLPQPWWQTCLHQEESPSEAGNTTRGHFNATGMTAASIADRASGTWDGPDIPVWKCLQSKSPDRRSERSWSCTTNTRVRQLHFKLCRKELEGTEYPPFKLDLTLQVLEQDEVLQQDVPSEVAVAQLQVHQLYNGRTGSNRFFTCVHTYHGDEHKRIKEIRRQSLVTFSLVKNLAK